MVVRRTVADPLRRSLVVSKPDVTGNGLPVLRFHAAHFVVDGFRTGAIEGQRGLNERAKQPGLFWFFVAVHTLMGTGFVVGTLLRLAGKLT